MSLPSYYLDPLVFGDVRTGCETIPHLRDDSRLALGLTWLGGLAISQGKAGIQGTFKDLYLDDQSVGTWHLDLTIQGKVKDPDPAQRKWLQQDGHDILNVLHAVDPTYGLSLDARIWHISSALLIRAVLEHQQTTWTFQTPLGRLLTFATIHRAEKENA